jgi:hypothetical protein
VGWRLRGVETDDAADIRSCGQDLVAECSISSVREDM